MKRLLLFVAFLAILISCQNDDPKPSSETTLLTVSIGAKQQTDQTDDWIIVHDSQGKVLAYQSYESGQDFELKTSDAPSGSVMVTTFNKYTNLNQSIYTATTYFNVEVGQRYIRSDLPTLNSGLQNGSFQVTMDYPYFEIFNQISTKNFGGGGGASFQNSILTVDGITYEGASKYLLSAVRYDEIRYMFLNDVKAGDKYSLSFDNLNKFENEITFTFPKSADVQLSVLQTEADQKYNEPGYNVRWSLFGDQRSSIKAGYIASLSNPFTGLFLTYDTYSMGYTNYGAIPGASPSWPLPADFKITSKSITDFGFDASASFVYRQTTWRISDTTNGFSWTAMSPDHSHVVPQLPEEMKIKYPFVKMENLKYSSTIFNVKSPDYKSVLTSAFNYKGRPPGEKLFIYIY